MSKPVKCRFCAGEAIARWGLDEGCFVYPNDREQDLCPQHYVKATPRNRMWLIQVHNQAAFEWVMYNRTVQPFHREKTG